MKKTGKIMMLVGIMIILIPIVGTIYTYYEGQKLYASYLQQLENTVESTRKDKFEEENIKDSVIEETKKPKNLNKEGIREGDVIGKIIIPCINVDLLLVEGATKNCLKRGAGHMEGTAFPGEVGNCAIAGHRNYTFGQMFNRLDEVKIGDGMTLEIGETHYNYKVTKIDIVEPSDLSVLDAKQDKSMVTLITCHPVYRATHRLIVRGEVVTDDKVLD